MAHPGRSTRSRQPSSRGKRRFLRFELLDQRRVLASIAGQVFGDLDQSLRIDAGETGLEDRLVYLDLNDDGRISAGEPLHATDAEGRFAFDDLNLGDYVVRLFNGSGSQRQTTPLQLEFVDNTIELSEAASGIVAGNDLVAYAIVGRHVAEIDLESGQVRSVELPSTIRSIELLSDGRVLAILEGRGEDAGGDGSSPAAVVISFVSDEVVPLDLGLESDEYQGADVVLSRGDRGLLIPESGAASVTLRSLQRDPDTLDLVSIPLPVQVPAGTRGFASASGPLILLSQPAETGRTVSLWSTTGNTPVPQSEVVVADVIEMLAFDDATSLAIARQSDGGVRILDAANGFATLHTLPTWTGPIVFDSQRELLIGVLDDLTLGIFDTRDGRPHPGLPLDTAAAGVVGGLALADGGKRIVLSASTGISQIRLNQIDAHRARLRADAPSVDVLFGVYVEGENTAPQVDLTPRYSVHEDQALQLSSPELLSSASDADGDSLVLIQRSGASHGTATAGPDGSLVYRPDANFFGADTFTVQLSDGRDLSALVEVTIDVLPVDDLPTGARITLPPLPENAAGPLAIGTIHVDEVDGEEYEISIDDPRLAIHGNHIILNDGVRFNYEAEPRIPLVIHVVNPLVDGDEATYEAELKIEDVDDPPTDIAPGTATVAENDEGALIADLKVADEDAAEEHKLHLFDNSGRFVIEGNQLRLREDKAFDFEQQSSVPIEVGVEIGKSGRMLRRTVTVTVTDQSDPIADISLGRRHEVLAQVSGYDVGPVLVHDQDSHEHEISVDDRRFEIVDGHLKLRSGVFVRSSDQSEILITITATETGDPPSTLSKEFILNVIGNDAPWHNTASPTDVDNDGHTEPQDAIIIINNLNREGPGPLPDSYPHDLDGYPFYDVNGDGLATPLDALIVINYLNRMSAAYAEGSSGVDSPPPKEAPGSGESRSSDGQLSESSLDLKGEGEAPDQSLDGRVGGAGKPLRAAPRIEEEEEEDERDEFFFDLGSELG